jgi:hypothetical protein
VPNPGDLARSNEVGAPYGTRLVIWHVCEICGLGRWVETRREVAVGRFCYQCGRKAGKPRGSKPRELHPRWKGGRHVAANGYAQIVVSLDDPLISMADSRGRVYEHRLVMARHLQRVLSRDEQVHHLNGNKLDNRLENLELLSLHEHAARHADEVNELRRRVQELEHELRLRGPAPEAP